MSEATGALAELKPAQTALVCSIVQSQSTKPAKEDDLEYVNLWFSSDPPGIRLTWLSVSPFPFPTSPSLFSVPSLSPSPPVCHCGQAVLLLPSPPLLLCYYYALPVLCTWIAVVIYRFLQCRKTQVAGIILCTERIQVHRLVKHFRRLASTAVEHRTDGSRLYRRSLWNTRH